MCTFKICVLKHNKRKDDKYPVSIRVCWKRKYGYIKTEYYVLSKQVTRDLELKDPFIIRELNNRIAEYEQIKVLKLKQRIELYTAKELAEYFVKHSSQSSNQIVDFIRFAKEVADNTSKSGTAGLYRTIINSLIAYNRSEKLPVADINLKYLQAYEKWLFTKKNSEGKDDSLTQSGVNLYMRTFKALFNKMINALNDEERGEIVIPFNPFKKYKMPQVPVTEKRALTIEQIRTIRDVKLSLKRDILARDVFMLSFYLAGMNTVDMYYLENYCDGRITYNREKTKGKRQDKAFISIKVEPEAEEIIKRYRGNEKVFNFSETYYIAHELNKHVNYALKRIGKMDEIKIPGLTFYSARHSFATIARNDCGISKYDIHEALNHSDPSMRVTDIYIKKDWSMIDNVVRRVLDKIR
jgi:integrase